MLVCLDVQLAPQNLTPLPEENEATRNGVPAWSERLPWAPGGIQKLVLQQNRSALVLAASVSMASVVVVEKI